MTVREIKGSTMNHRMREVFITKRAPATPRCAWTSLRIAARACICGSVLLIAAGSACLASTINLGTASNYAVLGVGSFANGDPFQTGDPAKLRFSTDVVINGNVGVGYRGSVTNISPSSIAGDVYQYRSGQYSGNGTLLGSIYTDSLILKRNYTDAVNASAQAAALAPTRTFGSIGSATTIAGNGGLNVIQINGDITSSLILSGSANDEFVINVAGTLNLTGSSVLGLNGGVTAGNVIYNFTSSGQTIITRGGNVVSGTLLALRDDIQINGNFFGEIIGGQDITLMSGARILPGGATLPEPSIFALLALGLLGIVCFGGRGLRFNQFALMRL